MSDASGTHRGVRVCSLVHLGLERDLARNRRIAGTAEKGRLDTIASQAAELAPRLGEIEKRAPASPPLVPLAPIPGNLGRFLIQNWRAVPVKISVSRGLCGWMGLAPPRCRNCCR